MKFGALRWLALAMLATVAGPLASQPFYPSKPIRFITPYPPGGATEYSARLVARGLSEAWGQQVLVENRPGGNTIIGTEAVAKSAPDGYTILLVGAAHAVNASLLRTPYDAIKDFTPVGTVCSFDTMLVVHPSVPANTLQELIDLAKSKPGALNYASSSSGGPPHLAAEFFNILAGVKTQHIPYKGGGPALIDLIGGRVHMMFAIPTNVVAHVKSGKLRGLAVTGDARLSAWPQIPTAAEAGLPELKIKSWHGILAPAGTAKTIVDKMSAEIARIVALADTKEKLEAQGFVPFISTSEEFTALMKSDVAQYARIIKDAGIKAE